MRKSLLPLAVLFLGSAIFFSSCSKDEDKKVPVITVSGEALVTSHNAVLSAMIDDRGSAITGGGFYWSRKPNPTANDSVVTAIFVNNRLSAELEDLPQGETFYYAAYATNAEGTGVSAAKSFTLIHNVPKIELSINDMTIEDQVTVQEGVDNSVKVKCSMLVPSDNVTLSHLRISYDSNGYTGTLVDQIIAGSTYDYNTDISFSNSGVVDLIFEIFDEYDNVTTKTVTVTVIP